MADVLSGLISPDAGRLVIDGVPLDSASRRAWRQQVAYVQQDPTTFHRLGAREHASFAARRQP